MCGGRQQSNKQITDAKEHLRDVLFCWGVIITMSAKYTTKFDKLTEMKTQLEGMKSRKVKVGALQGEHAWL